MFRESDYVSPRMHPSYTNKPKSLMQQEAELSRFEDNKHRGPVPFEEPPPVPSTYDTRKDPSHPDADWSVSFYDEYVAHRVIYFIGTCK